jgi:hypothetical protein
LAAFTACLLGADAAPAQQAAMATTTAQPIAGAPIPPEVLSRDADGRPTMRTTRISEPIEIDGRLDEEIYQTLRPISGFIQQVPRNGEPATEDTEVWLTFDNRNFYVSARCLDSQPERMVANEMRRDGQQIPQNENFVVVLDTFHDKRNAFWFQTTPLSAVRDVAVVDEVQNLDWSTVVDVKSARFEGGWTTEMAIPFKSLRYPGAGPQVWGINLRRNVRWKNEVSSISLVPAAYGLPGIARMTSAGTLVGLETPGQSMNLEVKPYLLSTVTTDNTSPTPTSRELDGEAGFDFKYGLTRGLMADFTYNTDFAQVEEDVQQVNLTRFNLQFREKRDFFLEGQGLFLFGVAGGGSMAGGGGGGGNVPTIFFSRQIGLSRGQPVPVIAGGRVTGKAGAYSIGALNIQTDDKPEARAVSTNFSVVRLKRDILRRSNVGMIFTRRGPNVGGGGSNLVGGIDGNFLFYEFVIVNGYYAKSATPGRESRDDSYRARFDYNPDRYGFAVEHLTVNPNFNPEVGFLRRTDFRRNSASARFSPRPNGQYIRRASWVVSGNYTTSADRSVVEDHDVAGSFDLEFQNSDRFGVDYSRGYEFIPEPFNIATGVTVPRGGYDSQTVAASYNLGQQRRVAGNLSVSSNILYGGTSTETGYNGRVTITNRFSLEPGVTLNWVRLPYGDFNTTLITNRFVYTHSPFLFFSSLVQYNANRSSITSSVRMRWEYAPRSELFVVYSEGQDESIEGVRQLLNRSLAVKITRLFRF